MKLQYLFYLFSLAASVLASVGAGPYQLVFFWYAYRLDLQFGSAGSRIAEGCGATVGGRDCQFDDFMRYIQRKGGKIITLSGPTGIGGETAPDVLDAVKKLAAVKFSYIFDNSKLLPTLGNDIRLPVDLEAVMKNVQIARKAIEKSGLVGSTSKEIEEVRRAMIGMTDARKREYFAPQIESFKAYCIANACKFTIETKVHVAVDGSTYQELDTEKILKDNPGITADIKTEISSFVHDYSTVKGPGKSNQIGHFNAIQSCASFISDLSDVPHC